MWFCKKFWLLFFVIALPINTISCGFAPLYSNHSTNEAIKGNLKIGIIPGKDGYHLKEELVKRLGDPTNYAYLLNIAIKTIKINEVVSPNNEITSYRLIMTANYDISNARSEIVLPTQKSIARTGFSSASNSTGYATQVAEEAAKKRLAIKISEKISTRVSILSENWLK